MFRAGGWYVAPEFIQEPRNLNVCPEVYQEFPADAKKQITLGDLHSNPSNLLSLLIRQNVFVRDVDGYAVLREIYKKKVDDITQKDLQTFYDVLNKMQSQPVGMVRLLGDEVADRGMNDLYVLYCLQILDIKKILFETLISNHGLELLQNFEEGERYTPRILESHFTRSMLNLQRLIDRGIVSRETVDNLIEKHYLPHVKLLSYSMSEDKSVLRIFSHAGIGLRTIQGLAEKLGVTFSEKTAEGLAKTIDEINAKFAEHLKKRTATQFFKYHVLNRAYNTMPVYEDQNPFEALIWNRDHGLLRRPAKIGECELQFIHGHDSGESIHDNIFVLNSNLGKGDNCDYGDSIVHYSYDPVGLKLQEAKTVEEVKTPEPKKQESQAEFKVVVPEGKSVEISAPVSPVKLGLFAQEATVPKAEFKHAAELTS